MTDTIGVVIADPSRAVRAVLRRYVESVPEAMVLGEARDRSEAVRMARDLKPGLIISDADLAQHHPGEARQSGLAGSGTPLVLITAGGDRQRLVTTFQSLRRGAIAVVPKPTVPEQWERLGETLQAALRHLADTEPPISVAPAPQPSERPPLRLVAVGASTGGPGALAEMLQHLGPDARLPVVVVQHIAAGFDAALAEWLAHETGFDVRTAVHGELLGPGMVRLAPAACHLRVFEARTVELDGHSPSVHGHRPSADVLFASLAGDQARHTAAVVLSGMGIDGVSGLAELKRDGALTIAQEKGSCAVWGMPRAAAESGAADLVLSPADIGDHIRRAAERHGR